MNKNILIAFIFMLSTLGVGSTTFTANACVIGVNCGGSGNETTPPSVSIVSPSDGAIVDNSFVISVQASDASGMAYVNFYVDGVYVAHVTSSTSTFSFTCTESSCNTGGWYEGVGHTISVTGYDIYLNHRTDSVTVTSSNPNLFWDSPNAGSEFTFSNPTNIEFDFSYHSSSSVTQVDLYLNDVNYGTFPGSTSTITESINFDYTQNLDGNVNAKLVGHSGPYLSSAQRNFTFGLIVSNTTVLLESNTTYIGQELYLILHDPQGDHSYSLIDQTSSYKDFFEITGVVGGEASFKYSWNAGLFDFGPSASEKVSLAVDAQHSTAFKAEVTDAQSITSSQITDNASLMGPGRGDIYWGEAWTLQYRIYAQKVIFYNNTVDYRNPNLTLGIMRNGEVVLNSLNAPNSWIQQNAVYNSSIGVDWLQSGLQVDGGSEVIKSHTDSHTKEETTEISIKVSSETTADLNLPVIGEGEGTLKLYLGAKFNWDDESTQSTTRTYHIYDDDASDMLSQDIGIDTRFGTYIFRPNQTIISQTSNPLEYNTLDYVPPQVALPTVNYDTNGDGISTTYLDAPNVTVNIYEEGGIQEAILIYSINNGANWMSVPLTELPGNPGYYRAQIPSQIHGTVVLWYIQVTDDGGLVTVRKDEYNNYFSYTVQDMNPILSNLYPNGGETLSGLVNITWNGFDADSDALQYTVAYNIANTGWQLLTVNTTNSYYTWDTTNIPNSSTVTVEVTATDGYGGTTTIVSPYSFTISN